MDTTFVEQLEARAKTMLPPATVMCIECAGDATGSPALLSLLEEVEQKGLRGEPLCDQPYKVIVFEDRVLLRCSGCPRDKTLPRIAGIGYGDTASQAQENALYALTFPLDKPNTRHAGCIAAQKYGSGPVKDVQYACILNRVAYRDLV
jgi:hypothetical protein